MQLAATDGLLERGFLVHHAAFHSDETEEGRRTPEVMFGAWSLQEMCIFFRLQLVVRFRRGRNRRTRPFGAKSRENTSYSGCVACGSTEPDFLAAGLTPVSKFNAIWSPADLFAADAATKKQLQAFRADHFALGVS